MGRLTEDLARLRQNINENRESRVKNNAERATQEYVRATSVNTMIAGFASARANQAVADAQGLMRGGHVMPGCIVRTTCELIIGELDDLRFTRELCSLSGYDELVITSRNS